MADGNGRLIDYDALIKPDAVHGDVYNDPAIFEEELKRIFYRGWVYIGHQSEIPKPGDYKRSWIGLQPVIFSRDKAGKYHVLFNRCSHRAASICQEDAGNAGGFRCEYHGWFYRLDGALQALPYADAYGDDFDKTQYNLKRPPRLEEYRGLVFASLSPTGPSLLEYLGGPAMRQIDYFCDLSPEGELMVNSGSTKLAYNGNWKLQMENSVDGYHPNFTHQSFIRIIEKTTGFKSDMFEGDSITQNRDLGMGHTVLDSRAYNLSKPYNQNRLKALQATSWGKKYYGDMVKAHGQKRAEEVIIIGGTHTSVFPNLVVLMHQLRTIRPVSLTRTEVYLCPALLKGVPEITSIVARAGADELGLDPMGLNQTDTYLMMKPRDEWRENDVDWMQGEVRKVLDELPGISYSFTQPIDMRVQEMIIGVRGDVAVKIFGAEIDTLNRLASEVEATLKTVDGGEDVFTVLNEGMQYLQVQIDRVAAGRLGLDVNTIEDALRIQIEGRQVGVVLEGNRRTPLLLRGDDAVRASPALFASLTLTLPDGENIPVSAVAKLVRVGGPVKIDRENAQRMAVVQSNVTGRDLVGFVEEAKQMVADKVPLPEGYSLKWGGQFENQQRAAARLGIVVPVALGLIFLLLFSTFGSLRQALLVLSNIPFALIGGVFALFISGEYLSVPASVGFIALLGIAVLNGVVLVSYFNQLYAQGLAIERVVVEGALRRLRPVLMTASIAALGLAPLLFASGPGSEVQKPLAIVVIGGLVTSTLLTLILLPILYREFGVTRREVSHANA